MIKYDYSKDLMTIDGVGYPLPDYRKWLLLEHEQLCNNHFIKAIRKGDKINFTYDWHYIYFIAEQYDFTKTYINEINSESPGFIPGYMPPDRQDL